jgi:hypothetical protein
MSLLTDVAKNRKLAAEVAFLDPRKGSELSKLEVGKMTHEEKAAHYALERKKSNLAHRYRWDAVIAALDASTVKYEPREHIWQVNGSEVYVEICEKYGKGRQFFRKPTGEHYVKITDVFREKVQCYPLKRTENGYELSNKFVTGVVEAAERGMRIAKRHAAEEQARKDKFAAGAEAMAIIEKYEQVRLFVRVDKDSNVVLSGFGDDIAAAMEALASAGLIKRKKD